MITSLNLRVKKSQVICSIKRTLDQRRTNPRVKTETTGLMILVMTLRMMSRGVGKAEQMVSRDRKIALVDTSLARKITLAKVCKNI